MLMNLSKSRTNEFKQAPYKSEFVFSEFEIAKLTVGSVNKSLQVHLRRCRTGMARTRPARARCVTAQRMRGAGRDVQMTCVTFAQWVSLTKAGIAQFASTLLGQRVEEGDLDEGWNELLVNGDSSSKRNAGSTSSQSSCPSPKDSPRMEPCRKRVRIDATPMEKTIERNENEESGTVERNETEKKSTIERNETEEEESEGNGDVQPETNASVSFILNGDAEENTS